MIYLMNNLSQNPKKMADGGMSMLPSSTVDDHREGLSATTEGAGGMVNSMTPQSQYIAQLAPTTQMDYTSLINNAAMNAQNNTANQNALAGQFQNTMNGTGPNPVMSQLATATGDNVANQASLMASQRGAGANTGMTARNAARTGAGIQQQAAGQAATLGAQQQLQAQQNLMNLYNSIGSENNNLFGTSANALSAQNSNLVNNYSQAQGTNAQTAATNAQGERTMAGNAANGFLNGMSSMMAMFADGGVVGEKPPVKMSMGGSAFDSGLDMSGSINNDVYGISAGGPEGEMGAAPPSSGQEYGGAQSEAGKQLSGNGGTKGKQEVEPTAIISHQMYSNPYVHGMSNGNMVPGKAKVAGDSETNDTVHALLSPGEGVIPRSKMADPDKAAAFAYAMAMKARKGKK